ncbi:MAG: ATP-binding cassette domain-containing protein, partial [Micrococcales bacterium]|nr:ATP-binding cassette domain-containing protein [Micrococcales bacterium]
MTLLTPPCAVPALETVSIEGLTLRIPTRAQGRPALVHAATDVSLGLSAGRVHALVGESGCGKSILASTLVGLLPAGTRAWGRVTIGGLDVSDALGDPRARVWDRLRGREVGLVAQSSATYLTPTRTVGAQLVETVTALHGPRTAQELLARVGLEPGVLHAYPHELSGG